MPLQTLLEFTEEELSRLRDNIVPGLSAADIVARAFGGDNGLRPDGDIRLIWLVRILDRQRFAAEYHAAANVTRSAAGKEETAKMRYELDTTKL